MKIFANGLLLISSAILLGCVTVGNEFCLNSGHQKKSPGYNQCTAHYQANREFFEYCINRMGIISQGVRMDQCIDQARLLKQQIVRDKNFCQREANLRFSSAFSAPRQETQPTLKENGDLVIGNIIIHSTYSIDEKNVITTPYINSCMSAHGWHNNNIWQDGKHHVELHNITSVISRLNSKPISLAIHEHNSVKLLKAAADGNLYMLEQTINSRHANATTKNHQGYTALHVAARRGNFHIVQALLEKFNASPDIQSNKGETPISLASYGQHHALVNYITEFRIRKEREAAEAKTKQQQSRQKIEQINPDGSKTIYYIENEVTPTPSTNQSPPKPTKKEDPVEKELKKLLDRWL